jgi:hypothetical protein
MTTFQFDWRQPDRVGDYKMAHKFAQISQGSLNQQMKVVIHHNVADQLDIESFTAIDQGINKSAAVSVSDKYILAPVAPVHHMVIGTRILYSQRSCHMPLIILFVWYVNLKDLTPTFSWVDKSNCCSRSWEISKKQGHIQSLCDLIKLVARTLNYID